MAQAQPQEKSKEEPQEKFQMKDQAIVMTSAKPTTSCNSGGGSDSGNSNGVTFKFNAHASEFVPKSHTQIPISGYYYPCFHYFGGAAASDWFFLDDQEPSTYLSTSPNLTIPNCSSKNVLTDYLRQKIIKQKIKSLITNHQLQAQALRSSLKLVVSNDGKKVRRKHHPFSEKDREQVQSRTVVVENLPEDRSHQNLDKILNVVGSVKNIRICHPQESNSSRSKNDFFMSNNYMHLWKTELTKIAEKAAEDNAVGSKKGWSKLRGKVRGFAQNHSGCGLLAASPQPSNAVQSEVSVKQMSEGPRMPDGTRGFTMG